MYNTSIGLVEVGSLATLGRTQGPYGFLRKVTGVLGHLSLALIGGQPISLLWDIGN
jgi:hypothetical protein